MAGVNIPKGSMASGEFSRGKESIRAEGGIVMVGTFDVDVDVDVDVEQQRRIGHLLSPLPREMRDDTAFQERIHAYAPGWDFPKLNPNEHRTSHFDLVSDFVSGRDLGGDNKTVSALFMLLFPDPEREIPCPQARYGPSAPDSAKPDPVFIASRWASRTSMPVPRTWWATATRVVMSSRSSCGPWTTTAAVLALAYL